MPGRREHVFNLPFRDEYQRVDPKRDGWDTEFWERAASEQLETLFLTASDAGGNARAVNIADDFSSTPLRAETREVFRDGVFVVRRPAADLSMVQVARRELDAVRRQLNQPLAGGKSVQRSAKIVSVEAAADEFRAGVLYEASARLPSGRMQQSAVWRCWWRVGDDGRLALLRLRLLDYEEVEIAVGGGALFADCTESVFRSEPAFSEQLRFGVDHWRHRLERHLAPGLVAANGLAVGDVNGDGLADVFLPQDRSLPNRLLIQQEDGSVADRAAAAGLDLLAACSSALLLDLDNDGDQDLAVGGDGGARFFENDGSGRFAFRSRAGFPARVESMAAADYDDDGRLDLYLCGHTRSSIDQRESVLGIPVPMFDAENGQPNLLLRNRGRFQFEDVTASAGLHRNNNRFSYAASWEDYDNDGDLDLYVANDFGRNNLYRNHAGHFEDVAAAAGVEDIASGMSVSWADYNRDGWMDLYVGNMFSSAGNRVAYQRQFRADSSQDELANIRRMARGNTLFENQGDGSFKDVSLEAGVAQGRWAWASHFADFNNDGWEDLLVANGFVTNSRADDL